MKDYKILQIHKEMKLNQSSNKNYMLKILSFVLILVPSLLFGQAVISAVFDNISALVVNPLQTIFMVVMVIYTFFVFVYINKSKSVENQSLAILPLMLDVGSVGFLIDRQRIIETKAKLSLEGIEFTYEFTGKYNFSTQFETFTLSSFWIEIDIMLLFLIVYLNYVHFRVHS